MVTFHESSMPCMDATHYYACCDDRSTIGEIVDSALEQVVDQFRNNNGFDPKSIKYQVQVNFNGGWEEFAIDEGTMNSVVPDDVRALKGNRVDLTYWACGYKFTLTVYTEEEL